MRCTYLQAEQSLDVLSLNDFRDLINIDASFVNIPSTLIYTYLQAQIIPECTYERKQLVYVLHLVNKGCSFRKVFLRVCTDFKA